MIFSPSFRFPAFCLLWPLPRFLCQYDGGVRKAGRAFPARPAILIFAREGPIPPPPRLWQTSIAASPPFSTPTAAHHFWFSELAGSDPSGGVGVLGLGRRWLRFKWGFRARSGVSCPLALSPRVPVAAFSAVLMGGGKPVRP